LEGKDRPDRPSIAAHERPGPSRRGVLTSCGLARDGPSIDPIDRFRGRSPAQAAGAGSTGDSIAALNQILNRVAVDREGVAFDPEFDRPQRSTPGQAVVCSVSGTIQPRNGPSWPIGNRSAVTRFAASNSDRCAALDVDSEATFTG